MQHSVILCAVLCAIANTVVSAQTSPPQSSGPIQPSHEIHVDPRGNDQNSGTWDHPVASLEVAQQRARLAAKKTTVFIHGGTYRIDRPWVMTHLDEGNTFQAAPGETVVITSDRMLELRWTPFRDGIWQADVGNQIYLNPDQPVDAESQRRLRIDELYVNGRLQRMARYPNFEPAIKPLGGFAADAISRKRASRWANPAGAFVHALHPGAWGGVHFAVLGKNQDGDVQLEGGWQNNRGANMHPLHRNVENVFEELDAPNEWFHDVESNRLYFMPPQGLELTNATIEFPIASQLIRFDGNQQQPVRNVKLQGVTIRHAARTFMQTKEPLLRSDWTIDRDGAVRMEGTEDCSLVNCDFDQIGGNAIFINKYNRRLRIAGCDIKDTGASAIAFVGDPLAVRNPLFEYGERQSLQNIDLTPGPLTDNYPANCVVEDCLIRGIGLVEKQAAGVQIAMSSEISIRHCSIYDASRAGINIGDGCWGGHVIEDCDIFDTVQETGDHGSFNSWGRDRYWELRDAKGEQLPELAKLDAVKPTILRHNRWRCDHGWDVDLDDGSSNYEIVNNVFLRGGLKLREGFHRLVSNNVGVGCGFHPHVWYNIRGEGNSHDIVTRNIWAGAYAPAIMPSGKWGQEVDFNLFTTSNADRLKFVANGCDTHSLTGDPLFMNREEADYRVKEGSPALAIGFQNFAMDNFGIQSPKLKKLARTPALPRMEASITPSGSLGEQAIEHIWQGAIVRNISGEEFSAFGVPKDSRGVHLKRVAEDSRAYAHGFRSNDLIQFLNNQPVNGVADLLRLQNAAAGKRLEIQFVREQKTNRIEVDHYVFAKFESAEADRFKNIPMASKHVLPIVAISTYPATVNEPLATLFDGKLARNYGPVFSNGVEGGIYKVDLGAPRDIEKVLTWSFSQNDIRGHQHFCLYGSLSDTDPGWDTLDSRRFIPIAELDSADLPSAPFQATCLQSTNDLPVGKYRWLLWRVHTITPIGENSAYQELQLIGP